MKLDYGWQGPEDFKCWGPYLSFWKSAGTQMCISWQSKFFSRGRWIEYGETVDCEQKIEEPVQGAPSARMHVMILDGLKPNTTYYYRISRPEDLQKKPRPIYEFRTGPRDGENVESFDFTIMGDIHGSNGKFTKLLRSMERNAPGARFIVSCGDCVTHGGEESSWNQFFYEFSPFSPSIPFMNATGNHDTDHPETYARFLNVFRYPYDDVNMGGFYHFVYGNIVFIVLDSDNAGQSKATQGVVSDQQMEWLEETLDRYALKDYWIFIVMHHQMYSTGHFGMMHIYELAYRDLFDEYHVDGVFYGHDHHFEVYWTGRDSGWGGTHYCLVGNAGAVDIENQNPEREPSGPNYLWKGRTYIVERDGILGGNKTGGARNDEFVKENHIYGIMEHGFAHFTIHGDRCEMRMWGTENQLYFMDEYKRTGTGKQFHKPKHMRRI